VPDDPRLCPLERTRFGEHLGDIHPDHCALGNGEERNIGDQQPNQGFGVGMGEKDRLRPGKARVIPTLADEKQRFSPQLIDEGTIPSSVPAYS